MKCKLDPQVHNIHIKVSRQERPPKYEYLKGNRNKFTAIVIRLHKTSEIIGNFQNYDVHGMKLLRS